jgi:hypothetical protein
MYSILLRNLAPTVSAVRVGLLNIRWGYRPPLSQKMYIESCLGCNPGLDLKTCYAV